MNPLSAYLQYSVSPPYRIQGPIYTPVPNKVSHLKGSKKNSIQSSKCLISVCLACIFDLKAGTWLKIEKSGIGAISLHCEQSLLCSKICEQMRVGAVCEYASGKGASSELCGRQYKLDYE